jgi:hypothetical protein
MKGCYVCFLDKDTARFVQSRIDLVASEPSLTVQVSYPPDRSGLPDAVRQPLAAASRPVKERRRVTRRR